MRGGKNYFRRPDVVERIGGYLGTSFRLFHVVTPQTATAADQQPRGRVYLPHHLAGVLRPRPPHHVQDQAAQPRAVDGESFSV